MNMNGGTSTSATDPHHHRASAGYLGMGIPTLGNMTPMTPPTGNGFGGGGMSGLGMGMPGGPVGPELKHHADFLSRLLAATPSYPNEVGNPPPGFFSDWLRRLVSKPGAGNGNHHHHQHHRTGRASPPRMPSPSGSGGCPSSTPNSIQQQTSSMTFSPNGGQPESNGVNSLESTTQHQPTGSGSGSTNSQPTKRRKRTRVSDHHLHLQQHQGPHHSGKDSNVRESPSPLSSHLNHNQNSLVSSAMTSNLSGSSSSSAAAVAAAASLNPFTHPLWFFPPFLPNPYLNPMNMNMGMNLPGLLPPHVPQPPPGSASGAPYLPSSLGGNVGLPTSENLLSSFRSSADTLLHAHHAHHRTFNSPHDLNLNSKKDNEMIPNSKAGQGGGTKRGSGGKGSKKSSSFSISRLTSPSPSSNSSGGSLTSKGSNHNNNNYNPHPGPHLGGTGSGSGAGTGGTESGGGKTASLALGAAEMMMTTTATTSSISSGRMLSSGSGVVKVGGGSKGGGGSSESGSETGASASSATTNCVDLRVSGRSWEKSGVSAPPPRSIYKPLSAFHDPAELNLAHSSTQPQQQRCSPDNFSLRESRAGNVATTGSSTSHGSTHPLHEQHQDQICVDSRPLSTTYVLKNLHHIYLRVKEGKEGAAAAAAGSSTDSFSSHPTTTTTTINNNIQHQAPAGNSNSSTGSIPFKNQQHHSPTNPSCGGGSGAMGSGAMGRKASHPAQLRPFNYFPAEEMNNDGSNHPIGSSVAQDLVDENKKEKGRKKIIDLSGPGSGGVSSEVGRLKMSLGEKKMNKEGEDLKISLARPIKAESNYKSNGGGGSGGGGSNLGKRLHSSSLNSLTSSSNLSFDEDEEDEEPVELRPKNNRYGRMSSQDSKQITNSIHHTYNDDENEKDSEEGCGGSDIVNVLSETEPEDEVTKSESSGGEDEERKRITNMRDSRTYGKGSSPHDGLLD